VKVKVKFVTGGGHAGVQGKGKCKYKRRCASRGDDDIYVDINTGKNL